MSFSFSADFEGYLRRKAPRLSANVRRLIDEAVAAGRITKVPPCASGIPVPVWDDKTKQLVEVNPKTAIERHREVMARGIKAAQTNKARAEKRKEAIIALAAQGKGVMQIAAETGYDRKTVSKHLATARGIDPKSASASALAANRKARVEAAQDRRSRVWALHIDGRTHDQIAAIMGSTAKRIAKDIYMMRRAQRSADISSEGVS